MRKILLIVAAGKSSRFGGFPKGFCKIGKGCVIDNTIAKSKKYFDDIYLGLNDSIYEEYSEKIKGCNVFGIKTGHGDAHSILKCLEHIRKVERCVDKIAICWGDVIFTSEVPFKEMNIQGTEYQAVAICSVDNDPYAWFEVDESMNIVKSFFKKNCGQIARGIHDQSLFYFDFDFLYLNLIEYQKLLGINMDDDDTVQDKQEMKLLTFFEYVYEMRYPGVKCIVVPDKQTYSFNTKEELDSIFFSHYNNLEGRIC